MLAAERSLVTVEEIVDELDPRPNAVVLPIVGRRLRGRGAGRRAALLRARLLRPRQRGSTAWDAMSRDRDKFGEWAGRARGWSGSVSELDDRRDDERRRRARAARTAPRASSASGCRARPPTSRAARTRPSSCSIYEAGAIGAKPTRLPLSIGDGILAETADAVVSVPEVFNYWLQPGRIDVGFLGAAQIDRFANINTTVIGGDYAQPEGAAAGRRRRAGDRRLLRRGDRDRAPELALVRRAGRLRDLGGATAAARATASASGCAAAGRCG